MGKFFDWTEARERKLVELIGQCKSATEIVNAFYVDEGECPTRNAVIGFISRRPALHGAWMLNRPAGAGKNGGTTHLTRGRSPNPPGRPKGTGGNVVALSNRRCKSRKHAMPNQAEAPVPMMLQLEDLRFNQCRWPFGDPREDGFGFCGHVKLQGSPYCAWHRVRSIAVENRAEAAE